MTTTPERPTGVPRRAAIAVAVAGLLVLAAGAMLAVAFRDNPKGVAGTYLASAIGGPFRLVDQNGKPFSDADLKGKWHLVFFGYTHCADTCPQALNEMALALDRLGDRRDQVGIVFITVDPERDTTEELKSYVTAFAAPIVALTGSPDEVTQAKRAYRVYSAKHPLANGDYDMDHSAVIFVMDPAGRFAASLTPDSTAEAMATRLQKLLS